LIVGTRGSTLALRQTEAVVAALRRRSPAYDYAVQIVRTQGDRVTDVPLSRFATTGVFVRDVESRLLDRSIDVAVHSLKDVPPDVAPGTVLAAYPERADPRDVLVSRRGEPLAALPAGARVGTSSVRRLAQLRSFRSDLVFDEGLRGNVDTRLRKLYRGDFDAIVLAAAGLIRLGRADEITEYLPIDVCLPDAGQGALVAQARRDDAEVVDLLASVDNADVRAAVLAERAVLQAFGGGCKVPVAAYGEVVGPDLHLRGLVATPDGKRIVPARAIGPKAEPEALGRALWDRLVAAGADEVLREGARA
jgi:hydroxymethylbilane synthase